MDVNDVFSRTVSFDLKFAHRKVFRFCASVQRPLQQYIGRLVAIMAFLIVLLPVPALIIYWTKYPDSPGLLLTGEVFFLSAGLSTLYFMGQGKTSLLSFEKTVYFVGVFLGTAGALSILR